MGQERSLKLITHFVFLMTHLHDAFFHRINASKACQ